MAIVRLKGVHTIRAKLSGGRTEVYHYAWRGGPRLPGAQGSPEFVKAFADAHAARKQPKTGTFYQIITAFKASAEYEKLGVHTLRAYTRHLDQLAAEFGDAPIRALDDPSIRGDFRTWRDTMRDTPRSADMAIGVLRRVLDWAIEGGLIEHNHAAKMRRLHKVDRSDSIWTADDFAAFALHASEQLQQAVELAAHTGLRQGDLIRMAWSNYDGESFTLRTSKRGKVVIVPATAECRTLVKRIKKRQAVMLTTHRGGRPWTGDGLRASFRQACLDAGVKRTFHDLRRTAATNLLVHGLPASQVALIMGWSEDEVDALKRRYVSRSAVVRSMLANMGEAQSD